MPEPSLVELGLGAISAGVVGVLGWTAKQTLQIPVIKQEIGDLKGHVETQLEDIKGAVQRIEVLLMER